MVNISKIIDYTICTVLKCERPNEIHVYFRKSIEVFLVLSVLMYTFHNWENHWSFDGLELNNFRQSVIHDKQINFDERTHIYSWSISTCPIFTMKLLFLPGLLYCSYLIFVFILTFDFDVYFTIIYINLFIISCI